MEIFKNFFECYFHQNEGLECLDVIIANLKNPDDYNYRLRLTQDLHRIIQTKNYKLASQIMKKYGGKTFSLEESEKICLYIFDKLLDKNVKLESLGIYKNLKGIFCPVCCSAPETVTTFSLIQKATIIKNEQQIYICKPCKLVWLTEDIRADNSQDYKKFMKSLGFKGTWKELSNIDLL